MEQKIETEAVETCPYCDAENVFPNWDVTKQGYVATCQSCGKELMLCDECLNADDNPRQKCNWSPRHGCFRHPKNLTGDNEMKRFYITITETLNRIVEVEAINVDEALEKVDKAYSNGDIVLDSSDYVDDSTIIQDETEETLNGYGGFMPNFYKLED